MTIDKNVCVGCGTCVQSCPVEAIKMVDADNGQVAEIDQDKCIHCGTCAGVCPVNAISE